MTLVVLGPVTNDLIIIGNKKSHKIGGASYFQSFVFEKFFKDYLIIANCSCDEFVNEFPDPKKVKILLKDNSHYFINKYPYPDNRDVRTQLSNFADIPILVGDLENILPDKIDGFILNPLNRYDFPLQTVDYLKTFDVPIFSSLQGFLREPDIQVNENYTIKLSNFEKLSTILDGVDAIFLDECEKSIIGDDYNISEMVITDGSRGSRIISDDEIKINAVKCDKIVDTTGCGDTYMAAYISMRLKNGNTKKSAEFASYIASQKLKKAGHL